jgi:hypothetical protein
MLWFAIVDATAVLLRRRPNTRLKLAAPVLNESGGRNEIRCGRIPFVNISVWCRSLSAIR